MLENENSELFCVCVCVCVCVRVLAGPARIFVHLAGQLVRPHALYRCVTVAAGLSHYLDPVCWDGDTSVDVPAHMDWQNNFEGAFRPERWLSEETRPRYMFTFGTGAHLCVGMNLVYLVRVDLGALLALDVCTECVRTCSPRRSAEHP